MTGGIEMDIYEAIKARKSIRSYKSQNVEEEKLNRILEAGRMAPSAKNSQAWKFIVTGDADVKQSLVEACQGQKFIVKADKIITVCVDENGTFQKQGNYMNAFAVDGAIALQHMILAATAEGLGTCWIGAFYEDKVKEVLEIPDFYRVVGLTPLGYPAGSGKNRVRKLLSEIVFQEKWGSN